MSLGPFDPVLPVPGTKLPAMIVLVSVELSLLYRPPPLPAPPVAAEFPLIVQLMREMGTEP